MVVEEEISDLRFGYRFGGKLVLLKNNLENCIDDDNVNVVIIVFYFDFDWGLVLVKFSYLVYIGF